MSRHEPISEHRFDRIMHDAYREFLDREQRLGMSPNMAPATRAGRFNTFIRDHYPILIRSATPDKCERYMERFHYLMAPVDREPETPLTAEERYAETQIAYKEFVEEVGFKGPKKSEVMAFHDYVRMKYPHTLHGFTEEEAEQAMNPMPRKKEPLGKRAMMVICAVTLALAGSSLFTSRENRSPDREKEPRRTNRRDAETQDSPRYYAPTPTTDYPFTQDMFDPTRYPPVSNVPTVGPQPSYPYDYPQRHQGAPNWQERYQRPDDQKGKTDERKR